MANTQIFPPYGTSNITISPIPLPTTDKADGTPATLAPTTAIQVAGSDGTFLRTLLTDSSGNLYVNAGQAFINIFNLLQEQNQNIIQELRAVKAAITALDQTLLDQDFNANNFQDVNNI